MVAPAYADQRSALAKQIGLGRKPAPPPAPPPAAEAEPVPAAKGPRRRADSRKEAAG
jgi:hypothetical protein